MLILKFIITFKFFSLCDASRRMTSTNSHHHFCFPRNILVLFLRCELSCLIIGSKGYCLFSEAQV